MPQVLVLTGSSKANHKQLFDTFRIQLCPLMKVTANEWTMNPRLFSKLFDFFALTTATTASS